MFPPPQQLPSQSSVPQANPLAAHLILLGGPEQRVASDQDFQPPKRKRGRLDDSLAAPRVANSALPNEVSGDMNVVKRSRGAQPGNQNARKHALEPKAETLNAIIPTPKRGSLNDSLDAPREAKRRRGGQPGNKNARTHGFYARRLPQSQLDGLEETTVRSLEDEIEVMRVFSRKVAELGAEVDDLTEAKSLLNTLANATGSINRLVRTHTHIPDPTLDPNWMLRQALLELEEEWPELKKFANDSLTPEEIAELDAKIAVNTARELAERQALNANSENGYPPAPSPV